MGIFNSFQLKLHLINMWPTVTPWTVDGIQPERPVQWCVPSRPPLVSVRGLQKPLMAAAFSESQLRCVMEVAAAAAVAIVWNICTDGNGAAAAAFGECGSQDPRRSSRPFNVHMLAWSQLRAPPGLYLPKTDVVPPEVRHMTSTYNLIIVK